MAINLSREDLNALVDTIAFLPGMLEVSGRSTLLTTAFQDYPNTRRMIARINFGGDVTVFTTQMITHLTNYGQVEKDIEALGVLLEHIADPSQGLVDVKDSPFLKKMIIGYQMLPGISTKEKLVETEPKTGAASSEEASSNDSDSSVTDIDDCYIFISYAHANSAVATAIGDALEANGYGFFQDIREIKSGDRWSQKIETALRKAGRMVLLLSKTSMPFRKEVEREWFFFDMKGKPIHTVLVEDCDVNSRLEQIIYIDARSDVDGAIKNLIATLDEHCKQGR